MRFCTLVFAALLAAVSIPLLAQEHDVVFFNHAATAFAVHGDLGAGQPSDEALQKVRSALNLSDVQVTALKALVTMRQQAVEKAMQSVGEAHRKLEEISAQNNPNPADVGNAYLAVHGTENEMQTAEDKFRTDFRALLDAGQRAALDKLKTQSDQINSLTELGVVDGGFLHAFTTPLPMPGTSGAIGIQRHLSNER